MTVRWMDMVDMTMPKAKSVPPMGTEVNFSAIAESKATIKSRSNIGAVSAIKWLLQISQDSMRARPVVNSFGVAGIGSSCSCMAVIVTLLLAH